MKKLAILIFALLCSSCIAFAQTETATISGRVTDPTGASIVGAEVQVENIPTGLSTTTKTNSSGLYVVTALQPGKYRVIVSNPGFRQIVKPDVVLNVQDNASVNFGMTVGSASETVTVEGGAPLINTQDASVSTVIDRNFVDSLPLNGRSFNTLLQLTPGVTVAPATPQSPGQFSVAGQRTDANSFSVDGVSANFGVGSALGIGGTGTGTAQALSALGGTSSLVSVEALQEFRVQTSSFAPEFGRSPGGQVILSTRSGTNDFRGGIYEYFRNTVMDANDWFASERGQPRAPEHHNDFGGFLGGPIWKDKTFFFASYEGARLGLPQSQVLQVPSKIAREQAPSALAPFLDAYPLPNGQPVSGTAFTAPFTQSVSNRATLDAGSIRIDHVFNDHFSAFGRYNRAPSSVVLRGFDQQTTTTNTQTLTAGANIALGGRVVDTFRGNYSTQDSGLSYALNSSGGATPLDPALLSGSLSPASTFLEFATLDTTVYATGPNARNNIKQINIVDDVSWTHRAHQLKFGGDYRDILLDKRPFQHELIYNASTVQDFVATGRVRLVPATAAPAQLSAHALSLYGQDTWKISRRLTSTFGARWELNPAPSSRGGTVLAAWTNTSNPAAIGLAPPGTSLWKTTYTNFAPRLGIAYSLTQKGDFVLRAGGGVFYDLAVGQTAQLATSFPNFSSAGPATVSLPMAGAVPSLPVLSSLPPFSGAQGYASDLKLPRSYQWNVALEKSFGARQAISATYVGQAGRDLLRQEALFRPNPSFTGAFLLKQNDAQSNYDALQLQYRRPLSARIQALLNYTWAHSTDNASNDLITGLSNTVISSVNDYASSDFDVRQSFSGAISYDVPAAAKSGFIALLTGHWSVQSVVVARTGLPFNALVAGVGIQGTAFTRPDLVPGQPLWIMDPTAGGGKSLNADAFQKPTTPRQGTEGRNDIPGFGLTQIDLSIGRKFPVTERTNLQFHADVFNVINHPNFANPSGIVGFGPSFLRSSAMLNQGLGGLNPLFQEGGPRSLQLSLKISF